MSKHHSRKSRWIEVSNTCYTSLCGLVVANPRGKWDAFVKYKKRCKHASRVYYYEKKECIGEYRRAREAMMVVEEKAVQMARNKNGNCLVELDSSLVSKK